MIEIFPFLKKKKEITTIPPEPTPQSAKPSMTKSESSDYMSLATRAELLDSPAILKERILTFLRDENIPVYNIEDVTQYLNHKVGKGSWHWSAVYPKHLPIKGGTNINGIPIGRWDVYNQKIPSPVLETIHKIRTVFPDMEFCISTPGTLYEDPFLAIHANDIDFFVVERWDEPAFRQRQ